MVELLRANGVPSFKHHMVRARNTGGPNVPSYDAQNRPLSSSCDIHIEPLCTTPPLDVLCTSRSNSAKIELIRVLFCVAIKADARDNSAQIAFISQLFPALISFCIHTHCTWFILKFII